MEIMTRFLHTLQTGEYPLPLTFRIGVAMDVLNNEENRVTIAADALHPTDNDESLNVGAEYMYNNLIAFRVGYKSLLLR